MSDPSEQLRIAYLFSRYPVVSQTFCDSEMLALEQDGFRIEIGSLNPPPDSFRHERLDRLRAEIHYPPPPDVLEAFCDTTEFKQLLQPLVDVHDERYGKSYKALTRARNAYFIGKRFQKLGVRHVHVHFANRATHSALFMRRLGLPFSFTAHAQDFMLDIGSRELLEEMAGAAEFVVAVSDHSRGLLAEMCPRSADRIIRIYNGIELNDFKATSTRRNGGEALRIVSVGRLIEFKGFQHLIGACALLRDAGVRVEARIIGEGPLRAELEERIARHQLGDSVHLLGTRSQEWIKSELAAADLFVLPSIVDPLGASDILPTVITEAMACELPVISTTVAGIPEMVAQNETGLLVPPGDEATLAAAIQQLGEDVELRQRMGKQGRKRAERLFTFKATANVLGEKIAVCAELQPDKAPVATPVVYLLRRWSGAPDLQYGPHTAEGVRWLACDATWPAKAGDRSTLDEIEILPDGCVIESIWLRRKDLRQKLEDNRSLLGDSVSGHEFYAAARLAVYLAETLVKRGVRHLHGRRSDTLLITWMVKLLAPGIQLSCAIEEEPALARSLIARLLPAFSLASSSDGLLARHLASVPPDELRLRHPWTHAETRVGPLRLKRKVPQPAVDRVALEKAFLSRIMEGLPSQSTATEEATAASARLSGGTTLGFEAALGSRNPTSASADETDAAQTPSALPTSTPA